MAKEVTILIDDGACPDGWDPERFGLARDGETVACHHSSGKAIPETLSRDSNFPELIIRKKYDPGITCIPKGWWVWRHEGNWIASQSPNEDKGPNNFWLTGLQHSVGFVAPEDGKPRQIK